MSNINELKKLALEAIENRRDDIYKIGDSIYSEPELGFKEKKTSEKVKKVFDELNIDYEDKIAITGIKGKLKGKESKYNVAVMAELDSVVSPNHPDADPETGAAHCCGHNAMIASLVGLAYALKDTNIMDELSGDVSLLAIPAEEYVELGYRNKLIEEGKINFLGGKQEFIRLGAFDDVDISMMIHLFSSENEDSEDIKAITSASSNGFLGQEIFFKGKASHAGAAPDNGINALNAANVALTAINANRETFKDEDHIRVHPIITKGGDLVNIVPEDVRIETYIRGANIESIVDATKKVTNSWKAGALAIGADVDINTMSGYLPENPDRNLADIMYENQKFIFGEKKVLKKGPHGSGSSDVGDVASLIPTVQSSIGGAKGQFHGDDYRLVDKEIAYIDSAKMLALSVIDLLYNDGEKAEKVVEEFQPLYKNKEEYLEKWGKLPEQFK